MKKQIISWKKRETRIPFFSPNIKNTRENRRGSSQLSNDPRLSLFLSLFLFSSRLLSEKALFSFLKREDGHFWCHQKEVINWNGGKFSAVVLPSTAEQTFRSDLQTSRKTWLIFADFSRETTDEDCLLKTMTILQLSGVCRCFFFFFSFSNSRDIPCRLFDELRYFFFFLFSQRKINRYSRDCWVFWILIN